MIDLSGQLALVTGSGSGIGRAIAQTLTRAGASVAVSDINLDSAKQTVQMITDNGGTAASFYVDIADQKAVQDLRDAVTESMGTPSILVNNAGWEEIKPFIETDRAFWEKIVSINYMGPVAITKAFLLDMIERGEGGKIVNIASDAGRVGSLGETVYAGTKAGVIGFTKSLARETARYEINVNCVCPGPTDTPLLRAQSEKMQQALTRAIPYRRLTRVEEVADAVAFFASDLSTIITGQVLSVSGGLTMNG